MAQALYRKWRPHHWQDVVGQEHIIQTLRNAVAAQRLAHAYLFAGPRGTGKTTTARLLAKAANCLDDDPAGRPCDRCEHCLAVNEGRFLDLIEIDAASNTSVEDVRDLRDKINFSPNVARFKVYIIDEVHMLSTAAFNALLKTLEEPPAHAIFILATTEMHKIPATVLSRCQRHEFRRIPVKDIVSYLTRICQAETIQHELAALEEVARQSAGGMRDAISLLDQLASTGDIVNLVTAQAVMGTATNEAVLHLVDAVVQKDPSAGLNTLHKALDAGSDPRQFARQVVDYLRSVLMSQVQNGELLDLTPEMGKHIGQHAQALPGPELLRLIRIFNQAAAEPRGAWLPSLPLEMALMEALTAASRTAPEDMPQPPATAHASAAAVGATPLARRSAPAPRDPAPAAAEEAPVAVETPVLEADTPVNRTLEQNWNRILELIRGREPSLYGLVNSVRSRQIKDRVLYLGMATLILCKKLDTPAHVTVIQEVLRQVFKEEMEVRVFTREGKESTPPPGVDSDGMVSSALRDLGGKIVDKQ